MAIPRQRHGTEKAAAHRTEPSAGRSGHGFVGGGQLRALLGPGRARPHEHPRRPVTAVVADAADQGGVAIPGQLAGAEAGYPAFVVGGQLRALLRPGRPRAHEHPRRPHPAVVGDRADKGGVAIPR